MGRYSISRRQAYRYFQRARTAGGPVAIPEDKRVFTVKLSGSLIIQVRQQARRQRATISQWVEEALRRSLNAPRGHG
jgi:predicted HicB family RNase H-like nuclease